MITVGMFEFDCRMTQNGLFTALIFQEDEFQDSLQG